MNIFIIPSWYPSPSNPLPGIFFKDQALALSKHFPKSNFAISSWGQNDDRLLLWAESPLKSLAKKLDRQKPVPFSKNLSSNLLENFTPAFTWSSKILHGNIKEIIQVNISNLNQFQQEVGKVDVIHAHVGYPAGYIAKNISKAHGIPYVITEHMSPFPHKYYQKPSGSLNHKLSAAYSRSSQNIAVSGALENQMKSHGISQTTIIPNLVNDAFFTLPPKLKVREQFTFFSLGRMVPQKGIDILLKAFSKIKSDALLRIGGDGGYLNTYQNQAKMLGIADKIEWLGELNQKEAIDEFIHCDAFVLPSRHESMGIVFAESMACGKPVIGSICGGPEEFINDSNGYLVEPENEEMLIASIEEMIKNYGHFNAETIRRQCAYRFSSKVVCNKVMDVYRAAAKL